MDRSASAIGRPDSGNHLFELLPGEEIRTLLGQRNSARIGSAKEIPLVTGATTCHGGVYMTVAKAVWNQIQSNDHRLMRRVHRWRAPRWFRILMIVTTRLGDGWLWYALGMILLLYGGDRRIFAPSASFSSAHSSERAGGNARARSNRTAGPRSCRPTSIHFPPDIPSLLLRSRYPSGSSTLIFKPACSRSRS